MPNTVLFLRFDQCDIQHEEIDAFSHLVGLSRLKFKHKDVYDENSFELALKETGVKYLILAGHGDETGIGNKTTFTINWEKAGEIICNSGCFMMVTDAKVLLYCCKGGVEDSACKLMTSCSQLDFVIGPTKEENSTDLFGLFSNFYFNLEINSSKATNPDAIHRAQESTGIMIDHYSRFDFDQKSGEHICERCEKWKEENGYI